jgi:hypothetical protein
MADPPFTGSPFTAAAILWGNLYSSRSSVSSELNSPTRHENPRHPPEAHQSTPDPKETTTAAESHLYAAIYKCKEVSDDV